MRTPPLAAGAKLVAFAGGQLPLPCGSQIEPHFAVRRHAAIFDLSRMLVIDVDGEGAFEFLRRLPANGVGRLHPPGKALHSCMLNGQVAIVETSWRGPRCGQYVERGRRLRLLSRPGHPTA